MLKYDVKNGDIDDSQFEEILIIDDTIENIYHYSNLDKVAMEILKKHNICISRMEIKVHPIEITYSFNGVSTFDSTNAIINCIYYE